MDRHRCRVGEIRQSSYQQRESHTKQPIEKVYADKAYFGEPNRSFLAGNKIQDGIMRKDTTTAKFTRLNMLKENLLEVKPQAI